MKRFIGLGSDHETDVFNRVQNILRNEKPSAITLEQKMSIWNPRDSSDNPRLKERKSELLAEPNYEIVSQGKRTIIKINDLFVCGHLDYQQDMPELLAGIDFALKQDLPFYFADWSQDFPNHIFKFENGKVQAISLVGNTTYQDYPEEFMEYEGIVLIGTSNVDARNRFTSDAINVIAKSTDCLAHIGGYGHFDSTTEPTVCFMSVCRLSEGLELQHLVKAKEKIVYAVVRNTSRQF
ncbi:hypothetical protein HOK51_00285 [Candidatus Woesearchaeota archaeon]|jgi:hypothetical protein|nr:hypothetical protein [Candidatus Woesearchaeota archaeon]MBT6518250.1 hypothetical protein [Candidatus Woesearchaeota archaeon]MBT7368067.1 hypothetical protein [Candidatus Woesearchaeota archaeon]